MRVQMQMQEHAQESAAKHGKKNKFENAIPLPSREKGNQEREKEERATG